MSKHIPTHWCEIFDRAMDMYPIFKMVSQERLNTARKCILPGLESYDLEYIFFKDRFNISGVIHNNLGKNYRTYTNQFDFEFIMIDNSEEFLVTFSTFGVTLLNLKPELFYTLLELNIVIGNVICSDLDFIVLKRSWMLNKIINH